MDLDEAFTRAVREGLVPKIEGSHVAACIVPKDPGDVDVKFAVELGLMIMLDKPILAIIQPGTPVPKKLAMVAEVIVTADIATDEGQRLLHEGIEKIQKIADEADKEATK